MKLDMKFSESGATFKAGFETSESEIPNSFGETITIHGKDGITPHIGTNGNWYIGDTDTGVKAQGNDGKDGKDGKDGVPGSDGKDGKDGERGESGVYVGSGEMPENCNVQIDPDGEPCDIDQIVKEALFKPWTKLDEITFTEDEPIMGKTYENLGGMTEFMFKVEGLTNGSTNSGISVLINGYGIKSQPIPVAKTTTNYCYVELTFNGLYWKFVRTGASNGAANWASGYLSTPYNIEIVDGLCPAETMTITQHTVYYATAGKLIIYGR